MNEHAIERLRAAVGEYLEALDRLAALEPTMLQRLNCHGEEGTLQRALHASASVRASLRALRRTYAEASPPKLSESAPPSLRTVPIGSGQRV